MSHEEPGTAAYQIARARTAALIAALGLATYLAFVIATAGVFLFKVDEVAPIFCALIAFNLLLAATAPTWGSWRWAIYAYETLQVVACTLILLRLHDPHMWEIFCTYP